MSTNKVCKWANMIAFGVLLIGGLNFLLMGLFGFNVFAALFGTYAVASRIMYSLFGVAALVLFTMVLWKAFMGSKKKASTTKKRATATTASTQSKTV